MGPVQTFLLPLCLLPGWCALPLPLTLLPGTFGFLRSASLTAEKERGLAECHQPDEKFFEKRPRTCPRDISLIWVFLGAKAFALKPRALDMCGLVARVCTDSANLCFEMTRLTSTPNSL